MFTTQHYEFLAKFLKQIDLWNMSKAELANALAEELAKDNPKFDRDKFLRACIG
ncbi:hypothetical protein LCGC14_0393110 [marine sediment metagenome]|uniref:Uncharacterized protein n=1 Tax=marine sediment metagenome TaxID=412755 RepID=A0A0F9SZ41_9ZZZZ